jgi:hypothetical protein
MSLSRTSDLHDVLVESTSSSRARRDVTGHRSTSYGDRFLDFAALLLDPLEVRL